MVDQRGYERLKADPMVGVSDIEQAFQDYFKDIQTRSLSTVLDTVKLAGVTWKTAPKATCLALPCPA